MNAMVVGRQRWRYRVKAALCAETFEQLDYGEYLAFPGHARA
jgi:hypothetical protein